MSQAYSNPPHERLRLIASRQNSLVKDLRKAFSQAAPNDDGSVAIEGVKLVEEAIRSGLRLRAVFFSESARPSASGRQRSVTRPSAACVQRVNRLLPQLGHNTETILLPDDIFNSAVASETPQGVAALIYPLVSTLEDLFRPAPAAGSAALPDPVPSSGGPHPPSASSRSGRASATGGPSVGPYPSLSRCRVPGCEASFGECGDDARSLATPPTPAPLILGCAGLQDPGNFGTILRSAEAFGATGVLATEGTVSAANPKVARASAGSLFRLPVIKLTIAQALAALAENGVRLAVTSSHKGRPVHEVDLTLPTAIFIGSEGLGVPRDLLDRADDAILIPHSPKVESLNAAIAASILLYEAQRQRSRKP